MAKLQAFYNPDANTMASEDKQEEEEEQVHFAFNVELASDPGEPKSYKEALVRPERKKWEEAIKNEIDNFLKCGVWKKTLKTDLPTGCKPIGVKWVFKVKNEPDGSVRYKGRIVVQGFVQIPGIDFTHSHNPVAGDVSIRTVFALALFKNWECHMVDIEAAFLEADIEEEMFICWPEGFG